MAHPDHNSFNHAIAETAIFQVNRNGHNAVFHDLYAERFDSILHEDELHSDALLPPEIEKHCNEWNNMIAVI